MNRFKPTWGHVVLWIFIAILVNLAWGRWVAYQHDEALDQSRFDDTRGSKLEERVETLEIQQSIPRIPELNYVDPEGVDPCDGCPS